MYARSRGPCLHRVASGSRKPAPIEGVIGTAVSFSSITQNGQFSTDADTTVTVRLEGEPHETSERESRQNHQSNAVTRLDFRAGWRAIFGSPQVESLRARRDAPLVVGEVVTCRVHAGGRKSPIHPILTIYGELRISLMHLLESGHKVSLQRISR